MARDTVPAKPFADWLNNRTHRYDDLNQMAEKFGVSERVLYRYRHCLDSENAPTDEFNRARVDEMLRNAGHWLWDVYDEVKPELRPVSALIQPDVLLQAKDMYDAGMGMPEVARLLYRGKEAGVRSFQLALDREWINQGWERRSKNEAIALLYACGWEPPVRCEARTQRGSQCLRAPMRDSRFCVNHDPETYPTMYGHARRIHDRWMAGCVPLGPFAAWLEAECEKHSQAEVAKRLGVQSAAVYRWVRGIRDSGVPITGVRRETVERCLERYDDGITLEDLYSEQVAA